MDYSEFEKAVDMFGILTRMSKKDLKSKYLKLSKKYHPDMSDGSHEKFTELKKSYDLLCEYMDNYSYSFEIEEFKHQFPSFTSYKNWVK
ncbi:DnaJ domain-containing protein [Aliarcobacter vitoriensis]|uniref:Molecular chaperone DnaJ n=1 Tax=Aliarcobacter vitoriensis TaxID=2011099 RepID=A0A366MQF1_9BACT|nr:DnaJ domain-containing protein [Aliarcobacter vitoriensis]RBQ28465.1 molecular chaperone DnaJ [Aliarcobacter vitoriensis]RBQ32119.1 molecular chaperone DnaJ [Arcobacter sp. FW59]